VVVFWILGATFSGIRGDAAAGGGVLMGAAFVGEAPVG